MTEDWDRNRQTVRRVVLRRGGKAVTLQSYGVLGGRGRSITVPVRHCRGDQRRLYTGFRYFVWVQEERFKFHLNLDDGLITHRPLFTRTLGLAPEF